MRISMKEIWPILEGPPKNKELWSYVMKFEFSRPKSSSVKDDSDSERGNPLPPHGLLFPISSKGFFYMHHPTDRIAHTRAFDATVVEHWLEREIAQWVHPMKDRSDDPSHHELTLLLRSYISLPPPTPAIPWDASNSVSAKVSSLPKYLKCNIGIIIIIVQRFSLI